MRCGDLVFIENLNFGKCHWVKNEDVETYFLLRFVNLKLSLGNVTGSKMRCGDLGFIEKVRDGMVSLGPGVTGS